MTKPARPGARIDALRTEAARCRACPLWKNATQTVFGEGDEAARIMLVGEQPGDAEDRAGHPFVGPAGGVLDRGLIEAGLDRGRLYVTNAVKHFKWEPRGKRRLHKTPAQREIEACERWLQSEIAAVQPSLVVYLGATAARAMLGSAFRITRERGKVIRREGEPDVLATFHPSYLLRLQAHGDAAEAWEAFVADLRIAAGYPSGRRPRA